MPHHAEATGWTEQGTRYWCKRCDQCKVWRLVCWYYEVYPPVNGVGGWWWACADCLVATIDKKLEKAWQDAEPKRTQTAYQPPLEPLESYGIP